MSILKAYFQGFFSFYDCSVQQVAPGNFLTKDLATSRHSMNRKWEKKVEETRNRGIFLSSYFGHFESFFSQAKRGFETKLVKLKMLIMSPTFDKFAQYRPKLPNFNVRKYLKSAPNGVAIFTGWNMNWLKIIEKFLSPHLHE